MIFGSKRQAIRCPDCGAFVRAGAEVSRRQLIKRGLLAGAGISSAVAAARVAGHYGLIPPDSGGVWGPGETLTYATQRILTSGASMAREFNQSDLSKIIPVIGKHPQNDPYERLRHGSFADWRLTVNGLVAKPWSFSLAELKTFQASTQITQLACEEGWSFIAAWTGVLLSSVLIKVDISERAKFVVFFAFDGTFDSLDLADAFHPQTLLAYGLNGEDLPTDHGAPLRVRVARQLGYKSLKYLSAITVTDTMNHIGDGRGSSELAAGYSWYAGI